MWVDGTRSARVSREAQRRRDGVGLVGMARPGKRRTRMELACRAEREETTEVDVNCRSGSEREEMNLGSRGVTRRRERA